MLLMNFITNIKYINTFFIITLYILIVIRPFGQIQFQLLYFYTLNYYRKTEKNKRTLLNISFYRDFFCFFLKKWINGHLMKESVWLFKVGFAY